MIIGTWLSSWGSKPQKIDSVCKVTVLLSYVESAQMIPLNERFLRVGVKGQKLIERSLLQGVKTYKISDISP